MCWRAALATRGAVLTLLLLLLLTLLLLHATTPRPSMVFKSTWTAFVSRVSDCAAL
jgi:hypothetical protein